jgi:hypothetical protein
MAMSGTEEGFESAYGSLGFPGLRSAGAGLWQAQQSIMSGWQSYAHAWSQHRLEDLRSSMDLAQASLHARDPEQLAKTQKKWMAGVVERAASDMLDFAKCACSASQSSAAVSAPRERLSVRKPEARTVRPAA